MILTANLDNRRDIKIKVKKHLKSLENFWSYKLIRDPVIILLKSRKEINSIRKRKTDNKLVGWFWPKRSIYILDPSKFTKESVFSKNYFDQVLMHELSHSFFYQITNSSSPAWLNEGLACYLAKQNKKKENYTKKDVAKLISCYYDFDRNLFNLSSNLVEKLIRYKGEKKFIQLVKSINNETNPRKFKTLFKKNYNLDFNIDLLHKLLS
jgi:hypothetical protein